MTLKLSILTSLLLCLSFSAFAEGSKRDLLPTEALHLSLVAMQESTQTPRLEAIGPYFKRTQITDLDENERFTLGEIYFINFKPKEAKDTFEPFLENQDIRGRIAWQKTMQIEFAAFDNIKKVETMIQQYRNRFPANDQDVHHLDWQINNLASLYQSRGEYSKTVELIKTEVSSLPKNVPYRSLLMPGLFFTSFQKTGELEWAINTMMETRSQLGKAISVHRKQNPDDLHTPYLPDFVPGTYYRMEEGLSGTALAKNYPHPELRLKQYFQLYDELNAILTLLRNEKNAGTEVED